MDVYFRFANKIWIKATILHIAFGSEDIFTRLLKCNYSTDNVDTNQLDLPITPKAFTSKIFLSNLIESFTIQE